MEILLTLAVEDPLSEAVAKKILQQSIKDYCITNCLRRKGFGYLKSKINAFNQAAKVLPFFVLTDQDRGCPPEKIRKWIVGKQHTNLIFRIAVMAIESWVMADRQAFAQYFSISTEKISYRMDEISDPKRYLLSRVNMSKKKLLKEDILPRPGSTAKIGPNYNDRLSDFIRRKWDVQRAVRHSDSLNRTFKRINEYRLYQG